MTAGDDGFDVVTGAFSYSGAAIASELQAAGRRVRTLTGHPGPGAPRPLTGIEVRPLDFADPAALAESLRGARTLYNTYWVRFAHGNVDHPVAVARSRVLFQAAAEAGVQRIVHVSITHPSADSPYPYFRGKAAVEQALRDLGVSHAVLRPAILFGGNGVLINNIAWLLRHLPVFAVGGTGEYRIRPIHVDDLARLAVRAGSSGDDRDHRRGRTRTAHLHRPGPAPSGTRSAAAARSSGCPGRSSRPPPACSAWRCATPCSPPRNTRRWRTAWPTPTAPPPARPR